MQTLFPARQRFCEIIRQPDAKINLAEAALCIAWEDQEYGQPDLVLRQLDFMAEAIRPRIQRAQDPKQTLAILNDYLFGELGFQGSVEGDGPENSFLDYALEMRTGLPITISIVYMEIGWRLKLPITGVAMPGHFLARYRTSFKDIIFDPFHKGRIWSQEECEDRIALAYGGKVSSNLIDEIMAPPSKRSILARILRNLKYTYVRFEQIEKALAAIDRIVLIEGKDSHEVRDRGLLRTRVGQLYHALEDLERYAKLAPQATDLPQIKKFAKELVEPLTALN
jgi:regulator of sirC expression with transglutaminase-like and TPR domain